MLNALSRAARETLAHHAVCWKETMSSSKSFSNSSFWTIFLLAWALVVGALCRLLPVIQTPYPINDGGLFYTMVQDILKADYALPAYTSYNNAGIPFAYPPFGLYVGAVLHGVLGIPLLAIFHWLPGIVTCLTIPAFYLLAKEVLGANEKAALATAFFAMLPLPVVWLIMGGGLTRSFGLLFSLLTLWAAYRLFTKGGWGSVFAVVAFGSLLVLSHLEWTLQTLGLVLVTWVLLGRNKETSLRALVAGAGILVLTSPWWLTVVLRHGLNPFLATLITGNWGRGQMRALSLNFSGEPLFPVLMALGLLGLIPAARSRRLLLPLWLILPYIVEPRNYGPTTSAALAMLASLGLMDFLFPALGTFFSRGDKTPGPTGGVVSESVGRNPAIAFLFAFCLSYPLLNLPYVGYVSSSGYMSDTDFQAAEWIRANTLDRASFLTIESSDFTTSALSEWLPALTERINQAVVQGYEWEDGDDAFFRRMAAWGELQACKNSTPDCLTLWAEKYNRPFDYVLLKVPISSDPPALAETQGLLDYTLERSTDYKLSYDYGGIRIYQVVAKK